MTAEATSPLARVLVVDDERAIRRFLRAGLESQGYEIHESECGEDAMAQTAMRSPDLVLLDLGLPDLDGFEVVRRIREWSEVPILVISAREKDGDKIRALDAGADDYVTKPFSMAELLARMRVALRRRARESAGDATGVVESGELRLDLGRRLVTRAGETVRLTPIEYRLLVVLARNIGKVVTHEQLLREVWGPAFAREHHYVRVYMAQLRQKLERTPARPKLLITEPGVGYRLREE